MIVYVCVLDSCFPYICVIVQYIIHGIFQSPDVFMMCQTNCNICVAFYVVIENYDYDRVTFMHSECLIRAGFYWKIVLKCNGKPEGKSVSQFLYDKAIEYQESVRKDRVLLRDNSDLRTFIRSEREKLIPLLNGNVLSAACLSSTFDDDDMSNIGESWEDELQYSIGFLSVLAFYISFLLI